MSSNNYNISITNLSKVDKTVAIYQEYDTEGLPLIWISKRIPAGVQKNFCWSIDYGLSYGTTTTELRNGVSWSSSGPVHNVFPNEKGGKNSCSFTYESDAFVLGEPFNNEDVPLGSMEISTDKTFFAENSVNTSLSVYMNGKPAFAMPADPNGLYRFRATPTYFMCVTESKEGTAISGSYFSTSKEAKFKNGSTSLEFNLDQLLEFKEPSY